MAIITPPPSGPDDGREAEGGNQGNPVGRLISRVGRTAGRGRTLIVSAVAALIAVYALWVGFKWTAMRVYVPQDSALIVINKFGDPLPPGRVVVPAEDDRYKGVQEEVRGPGRYFLDPIEHSWQLVPLVEIPAGDPAAWAFDPDGNLKNPDAAPKVGIVSLKEGMTPPAGQVVVDPGYKGIQKAVLTPGTYKINPAQKDVKLVPATVVPPGSVGVVTRLVGDTGEVTSVTLTEIREKAATNPAASAPVTLPSARAATQPPALPAGVPSRVVTGPTQRGILRDVLQPGIYYLNPNMVKVTIVPIGYDAISLEASHDPASAKKGNQSIGFYTSDGYKVEADFTVVWGRAPSDAPEIVANIGSVDKVRDNVIEPAMKAACQNEGAKYTAKELIQGTTRSQFQEDLSRSLEQQVAARNIHVLLALIRNITIKDNTGKDATDGLLATIQQANIAIERDLTNKQQTETAAKKAELEQAKKLVEVARETVAAETSVKVANIRADAGKAAAETDADREVQVANIELEISRLDAQRTEILGKAKADVEKMRNDAEAQGAKLLVDALGSPRAYNQYIFAKNFEPKELKFIFAGPGTFWTDLKSFQDIGASKVLEQAQQEKKAGEQK